MSEELNAKVIIGNELAIRNLDEAVIAGLREEYMPLVITDLKNEKQIDAVHRARMIVKDHRVFIQKVAKKTRENAVQFQKDCISEEKRLVGLIEPIEAHLQAEEDKVQAEKDRIKAEAEAKEAARYQARVERLESMGMGLIAGSYRLPYDVQGVTVPLALLKAITDEQFSQFVSEIQTKKDAEDARIKAEAEARKAEAERLAKVAAEQEVERKRLVLEAKKQAEAQEAIKDEKKRVEDEKRRVEELERAKKEAAEKALRDAEEKRKLDEEAQVEKERRAKEAADRKAARAPDREKLLLLADALGGVLQPSMKTPEGTKIVVETGIALKLLVKSLREKAEAL